MSVPHRRLGKYSVHNELYLKLSPKSMSLTEVMSFGSATRMFLRVRGLLWLEVPVHNAFGVHVTERR